MRVFGDQSEAVGSIDWLKNFIDVLNRPDADQRSTVRRSLVDWGQFHQGVADVLAVRRGRDDWTEAETWLARVGVLAARRLLCKSAIERLQLRLEMQSLLSHCPFDVPETISLRVPEGYAFYAIYPEFYAEAARRWRRDHPSAALQVIGLRSIGTSLAAAVSAGAESERLPVTLRPVGPTEARDVFIGEHLREYLLRGANQTQYAIVDEGPGMSGRSFECVARWLSRQGVPRSRIHFFPSHPGDPGPDAGLELKQRWRESNRHVYLFEDFLAAQPRLQGAKDLSAGQWRAQLYESEEEWPASFVYQERRKYLLPHRTHPVLAKFVGLDSSSERKYRESEALANAGFGPRVLGLKHGFLLQEWIADARPLRPRDLRREDLIRRVGAYLRFRAECFPAAGKKDPSYRDELVKMARYNCSFAGSNGCSPFWEELRRLGQTLRLQPQRTDNRMHPWEWIRTPDGRILKTDAVDHCAGHDCIGEQDLGWDVAGAIHEFELTPAETELLVEIIGSRAITPDSLRFHSACYLAFQLGYYWIAAECVRGLSLREALRLQVQGLRYAERFGQAFGLEVPARVYSRPLS